MNKKILSCALALGFVFSMSSQVLADPLQDQLNSAQNQYNQSQSNLSDAQKKANQLESNIEVLDNQIEKNMTQISSLNGKVSQSEANISALKQSIQKTKSDMQAQKNLYNQRMKAVYVNGIQGYINVLFDSQNLGDFLSKMSIIEKVTQADSKTMANFADKQQQLQSTKAQLSSDKEKLVAVQKEVQQKQDSLNAQKAQEAPLVAQANSQVSSCENTTASQKAQIDAINQKVSDAKAQAAAQAVAQAQAQAKSQQATASTSKSVNSTSVNTAVNTNSGTGQANNSSVHTTVPAKTTASTSGSGSGSAIVALAESYVGTPYVWGGSAPGGFDCSGLTSYAYAQFGISIPRTSEGQMGAGHAVTGGLQPGDLLIYEGGAHVTMYAGGGLMVEAPHTGATVRVTSVRSGYCAARRILN